MTRKIGEERKKFNNPAHKYKYFLDTEIKNSFKTYKNLNVIQSSLGGNNIYSRYCKVEMTKQIKHKQN